MPLNQKSDGLWYDDCGDCVGWVEDEEFFTPRQNQKDCKRCEGKGEVQVIPLNF